MKNPRVHPAVRRLALGALALALGVGARLAFGTALPQGAANKGAVPRERESHESRHAARDAHDDRSAAARSRHRDRNSTAQGPPLTRLQADALLERRATFRLSLESLICPPRHEVMQYRWSALADLMEWSETQSQRSFELLTSLQADLEDTLQLHLTSESSSQGMIRLWAYPPSNLIDDRLKEFLAELETVTGHSDLRRFLLITDLEQTFTHLGPLEIHASFRISPFGLNDVDYTASRASLRWEVGDPFDPILSQQLEIDPDTPLADQLPAIFRSIDWSPHLADALLEAGIH